VLSVKERCCFLGGNLQSGEVMFRMVEELPVSVYVIDAAALECIGRRMQMGGNQNRVRLYQEPMQLVDWHADALDSLVATFSLLNLALFVNMSKPVFGRLAAVGVKAD
jgi:hypothetical protein